MVTSVFGVFQMGTQGRHFDQPYLADFDAIQLPSAQ